MPPGHGPFPAVVLLADAGAQDRDATVGDYRPMGSLADYLTRRGIVVLRCDARPASAGTAASSLAKRLTDVRAALNYLRTRPEVELSRLGLLGHGEGGNVALPPALVVTLAASSLLGREALVQQQANILRSFGTEPAQIELVVKRQQAMLKIVQQTPDNGQAHAIIANILRQSHTALEPAAALAAAAALTSSHYRYLLTFDPTRQLAAVKCPVLLLHSGPERLGGRKPDGPE